MPEPFATLETRSWPLDRLDPRARIVAAAAFAVLVALARGWATLGLSAAAAVVLALLTGVHLLPALRRMAALGGVFILLAALVPWTVAGREWLRIGPLEYSREGLVLVTEMALKAAAIALALMVLVGTLDTARLGRSLGQLGMPDKLVQLFLFTIRYFDVLHGELLRLRAAMKVRGFRPRVDRHTYRSLGYLVGMLLVRSLDRSERILAAMKCRGFRGRFPRLDDRALTRYDGVFGVATAVLLAVLAWMEWG